MIWKEDCASFSNHKTKSGECLGHVLVYELIVLVEENWTTSRQRVSTRSCPHRLIMGSILSVKEIEEQWHKKDSHSNSNPGIIHWNHCGIHFRNSDWQKLQSLITLSVGSDVELQELSYSIGGNVNDTTVWEVTFYYPVNLKYILYDPAISHQRKSSGIAWV